MKKINSLLLVLMMLVSLLSLSAFAAPKGLNEETATIVKEVVLKGTPEIDGKLDAMYTESLTVKLHGPASSYYISKNSCEDTTATGTVYAMYDDDFVYVFFHVVDETLIQADPEYIKSSEVPSLSDGVEVRIGDDLEEHFAPYDGSNDSYHHLYADAHGTKFSCYENSMGYDVNMLKHATILADDGKTYYVELAIPTLKAFKEGEIIEFEFQIDDLQDELNSMCAVGTGIRHRLVQFKIGGNTSGATDTPTAPTTPENTDPEVTEPEVTEPEVTEPEVTEPEVTEPEVSTDVNSPFTDVPKTEWYSSTIITVYENKLMMGNSLTTFNPTGTMTLAEAITIATRIHYKNATGDDLNVLGGENWYDAYVNYAIENNIIGSKDFSDYSRPATRGEMAYIFSRCVSKDNLIEINTNVTVPDVYDDYKYANEIKVLYKSGIVAGSDEIGRYYPERNISRAEVAMIVARLSNLVNRVKQ